MTSALKFCWDHFLRSRSSHFHTDLLAKDKASGHRRVFLQQGRGYAPGDSTQLYRTVQVKQNQDAPSSLACKHSKKVHMLSLMDGETFLLNQTLTRVYLMCLVLELIITSCMILS